MYHGKVALSVAQELADVSSYGYSAIMCMCIMCVYIMGYIYHENIYYHGTYFLVEPLQFVVVQGRA